ncbi:MAG: glycosyltransferase family protein [Desulfopila sp.]
MRIACYCQHVLGIGHLHRSLAICRELASRHQVCLIVGGPKVAIDGGPIVVIELPGLMMDPEFHHLTPCEPGQDLDRLKERRRRHLREALEAFRPDVFFVELYPFGRKAFRFELDPALAAIRNGEIPHCRSVVSLRDILVERPDDRKRFEQRAVTTLNQYFDGLLIHADSSVITLDATFGRCPDIGIPCHYTGFVVPQRPGLSRTAKRRQLGLAPDERLIVVSVGGGNVGAELLVAACAAFLRLHDTDQLRMQIFTGPYCPPTTVADLQQNLPPDCSLARFTDHFADWLMAADLSISMAGYNTCFNIVQTGVPALVYPFGQNREQTFRAQRLAERADMALLTAADLNPATLARQIQVMLGHARYRTTINLAGAVGSREQLERWYREA